MEKQIMLIAIITTMMVGIAGVNTVHAMPNDYRTPEPVETLKVFFPHIGQSWKEVTVSVNICDARFNPDCLYGTRRAAMEYAEFAVDIHRIDSETQNLTLVESISGVTNKLGHSAIPVHLDEKYQDNTQYMITVTADDDAETGKFWIHTKRY